MQEPKAVAWWKKLIFPLAYAEGGRAKTLLMPIVIGIVVALVVGSKTTELVGTGIIVGILLIAALNILFAMMNGKTDIWK